MKRLVFLLLFVGFFSNASYSCTIDIRHNKSVYEAVAHIRDKCKKDDILFVHDFTGIQLRSFLKDYCRFDREIIFRQKDNDPKKYGFLSCVLWDNKSRRYRPFQSNL